MNFFTSHSKQYKNDKVICLEDKYTIIGPKVFEGFSVEYLIFANTTKIIKNRAFSGMGKCLVYLPESIEEIEDGAFDDMNTQSVFYCAQDSYAEFICNDYGLNVNNNTQEIFDLVKKYNHAQELAKREKERKEKEQREKEQREKEQREREQREQKEKEEKENDQNVKVYLFDDASGESITYRKFSELTASEKASVVNGSLYIHRKKMSVVYLSKQQYQDLFVQNKKTNTVECPFCHKRVMQTDMYCPYCGRKVKNMSVCKRCGEPYEKGDKFCSTCGLKL